MQDNNSDDKTRSHVQLTKDTIVGHYRIIEKIGAGGMGDVYLAEDTRLNRKVALKFLQVHACQDADHRTRFTREAQAAAKLNHPNIVTIYEVSEFNGRPFFAMEYLEGQSLSEYVKARKLSWQEIIGLAIQVVEGIGEAHRCGVIHRDIKPSNILVDSKGRARILDFGLATIKGEVKLTKTGSTLGTLQYMSPEQTRGELLDERSDIFSFGAVLYEMIAGQTPFRGEHEPAIMYSIAYEEPEPLARYKSGVSDELQRIISRVLAKDKATRYQHADEMSAELKRLILTSSLAAIPARRRHRVFIPLMIMLAVAVVALVFKPWQLMMQPEQSAAADIRRVVVIPFKNETGDPSLDPIGKQVADRTSQGLMLLEKVVIVQPEVSLGLDIVKGIRAIARATGANRVVTGVYYKIGDTIQFQGQVNDSTEKLLAPVKPIYVPASKTLEGVEEVRQRVMGVIKLGGTAYRAPLYDAVLEFQQGAKLFSENSDYAGAIIHYKRAIAIDTGFNSPLQHMFNSYLNLGQNAEADSILKILEGRRTQLGALQQLRLDQYRAQLAGDWTGVLAVLREVTKKFPEANNPYMDGWVSIKINHADEAVEAFKKVNIERTWVWYWISFAEAYHLLGDHEKELETIQEGRRRFPTVVEVYNAELQALAAMGKVDELRRLINDRPALPKDLAFTATPAGTLRETAIELRAHGHEDEAMKLLDEAIRWYESQPPERLELSNVKNALAYTLYQARRWEQARVIYEELAKKSPDDRGVVAYLGFIAARQRDKAKAMAISESINNYKVPYQYGTPAYQRACIAAILGDREQAVALLKASFMQGLEFGVGIHRDFDLESLWDYPPFIELLKPKG